MRKLNKKDFLYFLDNRSVNKGILHINIEWIKNKDAAKTFYNLWASFDFSDCLDYSNGTYKILYHSNTKNINFNKIIKFIRDNKLIRSNSKCFWFSFYDIEANQNRLKENKNRLKQQKEFKKNFTPTKVFKQEVKNNLTSNIYLYKIDLKNNLYNLNNWDIKILTKDFKKKLWIKQN